MSTIGKVGAVVVGSLLIAMATDGARTAKQKKELQQMDPARYERAFYRVSKQLIKTSTLEDFSYNRPIERNFWNNEYKAVKDSLQALKANDGFVDSLQRSMHLDRLVMKSCLDVSKKIKVR